MKTIALALALTLLAGCAGWEGNGISIGVHFEDPDLGLKVDAQTAK